MENNITNVNISGNMSYSYEMYHCLSCDSVLIACSTMITIFTFQILTEGVAKFSRFFSHYHKPRGSRTYDLAVIEAIQVKTSH